LGYDFNLFVFPCFKIMEYVGEVRGCFPTIFAIFGGGIENHG
jgi:hypothetical protein